MLKWKHDINSSIFLSRFFICMQIRLLISSQQSSNCLLEPVLSCKMMITRRYLKDNISNTSTSDYLPELWFKVFNRVKGDFYYRNFKLKQKNHLLLGQQKRRDYLLRKSQDKTIPMGKKSCPLSRSEVRTWYTSGMIHVGKHILEEFPPCQSQGTHQVETRNNHVYHVNKINFRVPLEFTKGRSKQRKYQAIQIDEHLPKIYTSMKQIPNLQISHCFLSAKFYDSSFFIF